MFNDYCLRVSNVTSQLFINADNFNKYIDRQNNYRVIKFVFQFQENCHARN